MKSTLKPMNQRSRQRQGRLLAFGITGAMAMAVTACSPSGDSGATMVVPPNQFNTGQAQTMWGTNSAPQAPYVYSSNPNNASYLGGHGFYPIYGYPNYWYRPAPGSTVELVKGGLSSYRAGSPAEARASAERGGFGSRGGSGGGESGHGGGESGHGGGGE